MLKTTTVGPVVRDNATTELCRKTGRECVPGSAPASVTAVWRGMLITWQLLVMNKPRIICSHIQSLKVRLSKRKSVIFQASAVY